MVLSLVIPALSFSNASLPSNSHLNVVSLGVISRNGAVRKEYLGMNVGKYPVMPRKFLTASFDSGGLAYLTALILPGFGFNPPSVNWWSVKLNLFDSELAVVRVKSDAPYKAASRVLLCSSRFLPPRRISSRWLRRLGMSPNMSAVNGFVKKQKGLAMTLLQRSIVLASGFPMGC